jgi:mono/diheme cytochrome c family protein
MSGLLSAQRVRVLMAALPGLTLLLAGCDQSGKYPQDLAYPLRSDLIVNKVPTTQPFEPDRPGEYDRHIAAIGSKENQEKGGQTLDPREMAAKDRTDLDKVLNTIFGKPAAPQVKLEDDDAQKQAKELHLTEKTLENGSILYRRHCLHCHGLSGDGRGPTGPWLNPHPRDYRLGLFKFISTVLKAENLDDRKPRRTDLLRTLRVGIEGTSMPAFSMLGEQELEDLVSYVIHLSIRGEAEKETMKNIITSKGRSNLNGDINEHVTNLVGDLLKSWYLSNQKANEPPPFPYEKATEEERKASIVRGYRLFTDPKGDASCIGCHYDFGRQVDFRYDDWGTLVRPANLTAGVYRGGRRPIDLYWRISGGIRGAAMPGVKLEGKQYWDLVNFVQALPYPAMLPDEVRSGVYPEMEKKASAAHAQR